jgi:hypothetical protein
VDILSLNKGYRNYYYNQEAVAKASTNPNSLTDNLFAGDVSEATEISQPKECETCKKRKYQDQSNDPTVSFQTPESISPTFAFSVVSAHESEHVRNEQINAKMEGRKVVSQTVSIHIAFCPECGKMYVSGGTTRTVTKADDSGEDKNNVQTREVSLGMFVDKRA